MLPPAICAEDLNLLVVLDQLIETRSTVETARRLGRTQSAVSHALRRLRTMFDDPLLTRVGRQLELTERAQSLAGPLQQVLQGVDALLTSDASFNPATMRRRIRILATDFAQAILLPDLLPRLGREAPGVVIEIESKGDGVEHALQAGGADLALGAGYRPVDGLTSQTLFRESFVCVARAGREDLQHGLSLDTFLSCGHVLVTPRGLPGGMVDDLLDSRGLSRSVVLRTPHFLAAAQVVATTDLVAVLPSRFAQVARNTMSLALYPAPLEMPAFRFQMVHRAVQSADRGLQWFRELVSRLLV